MGLAVGVKVMIIEQFKAIEPSNVILLENLSLKSKYKSTKIMTMKISKCSSVLEGCLLTLITVETVITKTHFVYLVKIKSSGQTGILYISKKVK